MITTAFFTHCCKNRRNEPLGVRWWWLCAWFVLFWGAVFCGVPQAGAAQAASSEVGDLRLERGEDGLYLSANL